jgi:hypothetical protein
VVRLLLLRCEGMCMQMMLSYIYIYIYSYRTPWLHIIYPPMASNHTTVAPMMVDGQTSGVDSQPPAETGINPSDLPQEEPKFFCACQRPALRQTSGTARNPGRRFFTCYSRRGVSTSCCPSDTIIKNNVIVYLAN